MISGYNMSQKYIRSYLGNHPDSTVKQIASKICYAESTIRSQCSRMYKEGIITRSNRMPYKYRLMDADKDTKPIIVDIDALPDQSIRSNYMEIDELPAYLAKYTITTDNGYRLKKILDKVSDLDIGVFSYGSFTEWIKYQLKQSNSTLAWYLLFRLCKYISVAEYIRTLVAHREDKFILELIMLYYGYEIDYAIILRTYRSSITKLHIKERHIDSMLDAIGIDHIYGLCDLCGNSTSYVTILGHRRCRIHSYNVIMARSSEVCMEAGCSYKTNYKIGSYNYCSPHGVLYELLEPSYTHLNPYHILLTMQDDISDPVFISLIYHSRSADSLYRFLTSDDLVNVSIFNTLGIDRNSTVKAAYHIRYHTCPEQQIDKLLGILAP